jgi:hypothetical protein
MSGFDVLDQMIDRVRQLGEAPAAVAKLAAPRVQAVLKASASAGTTPSGQAWAPKKDGSTPLRNAVDAVEVRALGDVVSARLIGTSTGSQQAQAVQNYGTKRIPARNILPDRGAGLPKTVAAAVTEAAKDFFDGVMGGR